VIDVPRRPDNDAFGRAAHGYFFECDILDATGEKNSRSNSAVTADFVSKWYRKLPPMHTTCPSEQ
jgi:hypothetical protein